MTTLTAQVRKILREAGATRPGAVWTNRYKTCRTVKFYSFDEEPTCDGLEDVLTFCEASDIDFDVDVKDLGPIQSVIIRLPLND